MIKRLLAFLRGDMHAAEDLSGYPKFAMPPIAVIAMKDEKLGEYLVGVAKDSRERTDAMANGLADKASTFLTLVIGLFPLFVGAVALAVPPNEAPPLRWISLLLLAAASISLALGAIWAAFGAGMMLTSAINLGFIQTKKPIDRAQLLADEAATWNHTSLLNLEGGRRRAADLFQARRMTVVALLLAAAGIVALMWSVGGHPASLVNAQPPASAAPSAAPECRERGNHGEKKPKDVAR
jgi:hypothetical protein